MTEWLTPDFIRETLASFHRRCELIKLAGGISLKDVVNGDALVPDGWKMDQQTLWYVPPWFDPSDSVH